MYICIIEVVRELAETQSNRLSYRSSTKTFCSLCDLCVCVCVCVHCNFLFLSLFFRSNLDYI